ncbi:MAG: cell division protein FtsW [Candidatus Saganbacteria bacterium]|uniref:Cell division protein FtsW n=1 Tax=Candidatus Saganbacteria bacterium TaxID=2575572 RepID=A0A833L0Z1_UNCSA|nr:MAG: cell division protein FtsW [Candidatus Saganbacteria bacterium]
MKKKPDIIYVLLTFLLLISGIIMIFSASPALAIKQGDSFYYLKKHLFYVVLGVFAFNFALNAEIKKLSKYSLHLFVASIFLLLLIFVPGVGKTMGGASRWLDFYFFSFQPSELAKITVIILLASILSKQKENIKDFSKGLLPALLLVGLVMGIIIKQPDMGTALSIAGTSLLMFFIAGAKIMHLGSLALLGAISILILSITSPYRLRRMLAYLNPWNDPLNVGFQIIQSLLAVGSGGIYGLGLGNSRQKFFYLPQQYADFIFAILCEELGLIGASILLIIFIGFFARGIKIAREARDYFSQLLAYGITFMFAVQTFMNLFVVVGLIPTTGIPLPFISYGGTAVVINLFAAGLVANISRASK